MTHPKPVPTEPTAPKESLDDIAALSPAHAPGPHKLQRIFFADGGLRAGWGILLFLLLFIGSGSAISRLHLLPRRPHTAAAGQTAPEMPAGRSVAGEGISLGLVVLATLVMSRIERRPFAVYGLGGRARLLLFVQGLFWGLILLSLLVLLLWRSHLLVFDRLLLSPAEILHYALVWALGFLVVGLFEELFLRGYLQYTLARGLAALYRYISPAHAGTLGFWTAALLLSSVFGLGHQSNPGESPIGLFAAGVAGLVFTFSLWRTGSLWWAIGLHASWDWAQSFLYGVADSGTLVQHHLLASHTLGRPLLSGGATGPEGSLFVLPTLGLAALVIAFTLPRTAQGIEARPPLPKLTPALERD